MLGLSFRLPTVSDAHHSVEPMETVFARAIEAAEDVGGAFATSPCVFRDVSESLSGDDGVSWVLVTHTRSPEPDHEAHLRERSRTAVQRFMLSIQCDDLDAVWVSDADAVQAAFDGARLDEAHAAPMGLVRVARLA